MNNTGKETFNIPYNRHNNNKTSKPSKSHLQHIGYYSKSDAFFNVIEN